MTHGPDRATQVHDRGAVGGSGAATVVGAGPAGLAAALTLARAGRRVVVHERRPEVGGRFHGDFQGLENFTTDVDVFDELAALGVAPSFESAACRELVIFEPSGREHVCRAAQPLFHLVRRGSAPGRLDAALLEQARAQGVEVRFGQTVTRPPAGAIVAAGPRRADAIAVGRVFTTDMADGVWVSLSGELAPGGYAYLLVSRGVGTLAIALFHDFRSADERLARCVDFFERRAGLRMTDPRPMGGHVNCAVQPQARQDSVLLAGEAAGIQDPLFGFGIRSSMLSGHLAARALLDGDPARCDALWQRRLGGRQRAALVSRYLFDRAGALGPRWLARALGTVADPRAWLGGLYTPRWWRAALFPLARRALLPRRRPPDVVGCGGTRARAPSP